MNTTNPKKVGVGFGVMLLRDGKILLGKRHDDPEKASSLMHGEGTWTMPGGKLDFGESFEAGAARELKEETSIEVTRKDFRVICLMNNRLPDVHFVTVGMLCENFSGEAKVMEPDQITEWQWFPLDHLPSPIFFLSEEIIKNYLAGRMYLQEDQY
jgi:8-oxo-dGTP diphosphatase